MLLLIDNVIDPLDLNRDNILFPGDPSSKFTLLVLGCNLLFSTRRDFAARMPNVIQHKLEILLPDSGYDLLKKYRQSYLNEIEYANKIWIFSISYILPLAIVLVGGYLLKYSDITIQEYYEEYLKTKKTVGNIIRNPVILL